MGVVLVYIFIVFDYVGIGEGLVGINCVGLGVWFCGVVLGFVLMEMMGFWLLLLVLLIFVVLMGVYVLW